MSGKRNVSVCRGHELANALYKTMLIVHLKPEEGNQTGSGHFFPLSISYSRSEVAALRRGWVSEAFAHMARGECHSAFGEVAPACHIVVLYTLQEAWQPSFTGRRDSGCLKSFAPRAMPTSSLPALPVPHASYSQSSSSRPAC